MCHKNVPNSQERKNRATHDWWGQEGFLTTAQSVLHTAINLHLIRVTQQGESRRLGRICGESVFSLRRHLKEQVLMHMVRKSL